MSSEGPIADVFECHESLQKPDEEDEDEDVDFNPFLKETLSSDASSSLSSEVDGLDGDVDGGEITSNIGGSKLTKHDSSAGQEGMFMQTLVSSEGACLTESEKTLTEKHRKRKFAFASSSEIQTVPGEGSGSRSGADLNDVTDNNMNGVTQLSKPIVDVDEEDAICRRTRARYSLASFTLDELETFLQETDDDDDNQNVDVDDEKEYRKFLAGVLQGGDGVDRKAQEINNIDDDDDEDNDADFEIELEEALESASDDDMGDNTLENDCGGAGRRPETRQNRRQGDFVEPKKNTLGHEMRPMRPLVPILPNGIASTFIDLDGKTLLSNPASSSQSPPFEYGLINGFTPYQIGQLHCLIHEHLQLLIQVYSLCVLDSSRGQVASQVRELIMEMVKTRDQVLKWRNDPYPSECFQPPYLCPSVQNELPQSYMAQCSSGASSTFGAHAVCSSPNNMMHSLEDSLPRSGDVCDGQIGSIQSFKGFLWVPFTSGPVQTILDVAPFKLVGKYMNDVSAAITEYRRRQIEQSSDTIFEREPMFPVASVTSCAEVSNDVPRNNISAVSSTLQSSTTQQPPRKTLAATLVENAMKQSIAFVPKEIAKLAQQFLPLFNPALFPHKPPPAVVASRVLFTEAEDELLAAGILEYNSDWKAIQQHFLPCKSEHQIFVRQKNRSSSKAPDNSIKAVRKMKNSPLSVEEMEHIEEGLKIFKVDWMAVWKFVVPYRDPSLLPRQWRTALGIQKSYKLDAAKKEKRRLYEKNRRKCKTTDLPSWKKQLDNEDDQVENDGEGNVSGGEAVDNADEAYVHEGFLADWRPATSNFTGKQPFSILGEKNLPSDKFLNNVPQTQLQISNMQQVPFASNYIQHSHVLSHSTQAGHFGPSTVGRVRSIPDKPVTNSKSHFYLRPYRAHRSNNHHLVKLAPDLPPVNLPPSVRIISQTSYNNNRLEACSMDSDAGNGQAHNVITQLPLAKIGNGNSVNAIQKNRNLQECPEHVQVSGENVFLEDNETDSDLQMHPLLFQPSEDSCVPYYRFQSRSCSSSSSFSFFPGSQPQLNLSLFHNPHQASHFVARLNKSLKAVAPPSKSCGIDFHPLLQRTEGVKYDSLKAGSPSQLTVVSEEISVQPGSSKNAVQTDRVRNATGATNCSPSEKSNELDLDIHLSSTSRRGDAKEMRDVRSMNTESAVVGGLDHETIVEASYAYRQRNKHSENCPASSNMLVSGSLAVNYQGNDSRRYTSEDVGESSHPEIVMEQEELSDSDEEIEEHVEFECEEMADSEGEEDIGCDQTVEMQKKTADLALKEVATGDRSGNQQCDERALANPQGGVSAPTKFRTAFDLGVVGEGSDATSSSWLSLDSSAARPLSHAKPNFDGSTVGRDGISAAKKPDLSHPTRSSKKPTSITRKVIMEKKSVDTSEQLSLGSLFIPSKKPQKPPRRRP